ncbi:MAG: hypothetical protein ABI912_08665 [Actinomycetota bacterium]
MRTLSRLATLGAATALMAPLALASASGAMAATTTDCKTGILPVSVVGAPGVKPHQALGVYLWHDAGKGYSLRVTHPGKDRVTITGSITVSAHVGAVHRVALEKNDAVKVGPQRHTIAFTFNNYGYIDGFDFGANCSRTVHVAVRIGAAQATPAQVFLGKDRINPTSVPFTIERAHDTTPASVS